jgi:hypothetical protein
MLKGILWVPDANDGTSDGKNGRADKTSIRDNGLLVPLMIERE